MSLAPRLMAFHREWHATEDGRGRQFWRTVRDPSLDQLVRVIAVLEAVPKVSARPEFVADLRARLMADATATVLSIPLNTAHGSRPMPAGRLEPSRRAPQD